MSQFAADISRLYQDVQFLTSINSARNYQNIYSLEQAAAYIYKHFSALSFDQLELQKILPD